MGQNASTAYGTAQPGGQASPRRSRSPQRQRSQSTPPPRPASPPQTPKIPNYAVPENRVLPIGAMQQVPNKRQLLRPVSQELTKFHPDFADIFQYEDGDPEKGLDGFGSTEDADAGVARGPGPATSAGRGRATANGSAVGAGKENNARGKDSQTSRSALENGGVHHSSRMTHTVANGDVNWKPNNIELSRSMSLQEKRSSGQHLHMNGHVSTNPNGSDVTDRGGNRGPVQRTNSLDRAPAKQSKLRGHKRYPSATNSLANEASVIPEDPREHLYTHWRQDPFTNPMPSVTSLPIKNSFELDYKMNLTYAQLAEHRRQKRVADLEDKTGKKLSDLNTDLKDKSTVPVSPFDRNNYTPSQPSSGSTTTGSSDAGVSKSKKRRAPPPPGAAGARHRDSSPGGFSLDVEPPADYDSDDPSPPLDAPSPWKPSLARQDSTASGSSRFSRTSKGPAPAPPPAPPPPPTPPQTAAAKRGSKSTPSGGGSPSATKADGAGSTFTSSSARLIAQTKAEIEALKKLETILRDKEKPAGDEEAESATAKDSTEAKAQSESKEVYTIDLTDKSKEAESDTPARSKDGKTSPMSISSADTEDASANNSKAESSDKPNNSPRRLNSLLQHDIQLAAQTRSAKGQVKAKIPVKTAKPKDPAELFREELAKAANARERRIKSSGSDKENNNSSSNNDAGNTEEDEKDGSLVFKSDMVKVKRKTAVSEVSTAAKEDTPPPTSPPPPPLPSTLPPPMPPSPPPPMPTDPDSPRQKYTMSKSEPDLLASQSRNYDPTQRPRQRHPGGYIENSDALRKAASHDGILDLSDDDNDDDENVPSAAAADRRASSSNRQFSEDWKPEDDLDTDDDMMNDDLTYSRTDAVQEGTDGFKSSIIPQKVDDLKTAKRKSSKSPAKSNSRRESASSSNDEKTKFGSIRKFQKSVHKGVKNAFGSISKASGKLLRKNKSHDLGLEDVEGKVYRVSREGDTSNNLRLKSASMANGLDDQPNGRYEMVETDGENSNDDTDLDDNAVDDYNDNDTQRRTMKRAGVAYVGRKGQIVVLPEFESVPVDEEGNVINDKDDEGGRAPRIFKKKKKKFTYESTVRRQEKDRAMDLYEEEIREKERQIEFERRKQQDMEREFQRLRDMETQERLQRLQTAQLQQQMHLLQQQQQQLTSLQILQQPTSGVHHSHHHHAGLYTTSSGGLGSHHHHLPPVNMSTYTLQQQQTTPFITPAAVSGTAAAATTANTVAGYDVNYLGNYMRMMGIQPPTTQQQWAYLLTSVNLHSPQSLFDPASSAKGQALLVGTSSGVGPDLSYLFPSKTAPAYPSSSSSSNDSAALVAQKATLMNLLSSGHLPQPLPVQTLPTTGAVVPASSGAVAAEPIVSRRQAPKSSARPKSVGAVMVADKPAGDDDDLTATSQAKERANPVYFSSDDEEELARKADEAMTMRKSSAGRAEGRRPRPQSSVLPLGQTSMVYHDVTSREEAGVMRVRVPDYRSRSVYIVDDDDGDDDASDGATPRRGADDSVADVRDMSDIDVKDVSSASAGSSNSNGGSSNGHSGGSTNAQPSAIVTVQDATAKKTVQFQINGPAAPTSTLTTMANGVAGGRTASLSPSVYGPVGFKPVAFTPGNARTNVQNQGSVDS